MGNLGVGELLIIILILIFLFGGKKLPEIAKSFGEGIRIFKKSVKEDDTDKNEKKD